MKLLFSIIIAALCFASCGTTKNESLSYTEAHGYFVRNDAPPHAPCYYGSREAFDSVFGCAAVMGEHGKPTTIDFARQSVIAIIGSTTNRPTEYIPLSLTSHADTLRLKYSAKESAPTTYTITPLLLLVVDKPHATPNVKLERE